MQKKNKPLLLSSGRCFATSFFLAQKFQTNHRPQKFLISDPSKLHFEVLGDGKTQEIFDINKSCRIKDKLKIHLSNCVCS